MGFIKSKVRITCELNENREGVRDHLRAHVQDLASSYVDLVAFAIAKSMTLILEDFVDVDGKRTKIFVGAPHVENICTAFAVDSIPKATFDLMVENHLVGRAMRDLTSSIDNVHDAIINCARGIEGLRHAIAPDVSRDKGWRIMQEMLNVDAAYMTLVTGKSANPRHGNRVGFWGHEVHEVQKRAWTLMNRFLVYAERGSTPLDIKEFPVLQG
jgi:hypothetical protein